MDTSDMQNTLTYGTDIWLPKTCGFIGGGVMADAMLGGFIDKKAFKPSNVAVSDILESRRNYMSEKFNVQVTDDNVALLDELKIVILSVKP